MTRDEAFKVLEARILELISRLSSLEQENARLQQELRLKDAQLSASNEKVRIAAEELHKELERLRALKSKIHRV